LEGTWEQVREEVKLRRVATPNGEEMYLLCVSTGRREKERALRKRFTERMEDALTKFEKRVAAGKLKNRDLIQRHVGQIQARYPSVNDLHTIELKEEEGRLKLHWRVLEQKRAWREEHSGVEQLRVAVMGCVVNGPGESKHAHIGISLPGTGEEPKAPVYVDGELFVTLRGNSIAREFNQILNEYVESHYSRQNRTVGGRSG
jgi:hypothetical protein